MRHVQTWAGKRMTGRAAFWASRCMGLCLSGLALLLAPLVPAHAQATRPAIAEDAAAADTREAAFEERFRAAYGLMGSGGFDEGYAELRATLKEVAATDLFAFTVLKYTEAGQLFQQNNFGEEAEAIFAEGETVPAMQEDVKERADFYLAYAGFKVATRDFARVVPLYSQSANLYAHYYGKESREVLNAQDLLAVALAGLGQFGTAVNLSQGNYDIAVRALGPDDELTWRFANNLADALRGIGAPSRGLQYDLMLLEKRTKRYGRDHFNVLVSANNAAQDYLDLGDYDGAIRSFELDRQIAAALSAEDPGWEVQAETWLLYTNLHFGKTPFDAASLAEMEAVITNPAYPALLSYKAARLLADHFSSTDPQRSMKHLEQALSIANGEMSPFHPLAFATRRAIANARSASDPAATAADYARLDGDMLRWLADQVMFAGSRVVAEATRALADDMLFDYAKLAETNPAMVPAFADAVRRWPTFENEWRETVRKLMLRVDPADTVTHAMLRRQLHLLLMHAEMFNAGTVEQVAWDALEESKALEGKINARLEAEKFDTATLDAPLPTARDMLAGDQALVSYFITRKWHADRESAEPFAEVRLYAIVWRKDREPKLYFLGDPRTITGQAPTAQVTSLRSSRTTERGAISIAAIDDVFSDLHARLFAPFEADLDGAKTIFIVPDGQLFAVPFSLLKDAKGNFLEDRYTLRLLTRAESLYGVAAEQTLPKTGRATLAGGLNYANGTEAGAAPLPGTLSEVERIAGLLSRADFAIDMLTGDAASELALRKDMEAAAIAHLATHGSYQSATNGGASDVDTLWQSDVILSNSGDKRSMKRDEADGRLYAFEIMTWDLSRLQLLVLSACETARGEETFVGGLRGLPTAISIAGARRSLLTLWPVEDKGTANFMARYYEHLTAGMSYAEALRQTRRDAISGQVPGAGSPLVWAAFVMFEN